jgi:hypothetical protein
MFDSTLDLNAADMQVNDMRADTEFPARPIRVHSPALEVGGLRRLAHVFAERPERILQELVEVAMDLCDAHSAGITLEENTAGTDCQFRWIATAGRYSPFVGAVLPRDYSPCGTCLERGGPQLFRVPKPYLDSIGVDAPPVTDGILIPWEVEQTRGTIWVLVHESFRHFDREDHRVLQDLSDFAAIAVRHRSHQALLVKQAAATAAAELANDLAHQINNPLQALMQIVFLAGQKDAASGDFAREAMAEVSLLSELVKKLLRVPKPPA